MKYIYILKVYIHKQWVIMGVYDSRAKAQRVASEMSHDDGSKVKDKVVDLEWDKDISITEWSVL